jgi:TspO/MBR family.
MLKNKFLSFIIFLFITFTVSFIGSVVTIILKEIWYSSLNKSNLNLLDWVFATVWNKLYLFMNIEIWLVWHKN